MSESNRLALIFGPGRSGTSVVTHIARHFGAALGDELITGDAFNVDGYFEDRRVVDIHKQALSRMGNPDPFGAMLPLPEGWRHSEAVTFAETQLRAHVGLLLDHHSFVAIKDPRISLMLPLWQSIAQSFNSELKLIFCMRHPAAMAASYARAAKLDQSVGEAIWINRFVAALKVMGDDGLILDFDDLLECPEITLRSLLSYLDPENDGVNATIETLLAKGIVKQDERHHTRGLAVFNGGQRLFDVACKVKEPGSNRTELIALCEEVSQQSTGDIVWASAVRARAIKHLETKMHRDAQGQITPSQLQELKSIKTQEIQDEYIALSMEQVAGSHFLQQQEFKQSHGSEYQRRRLFDAEIDRLQKETVRLSRAYDNVIHSTSYRLGQLVVVPITSLVQNSREALKMLRRQGRPGKKAVCTAKPTDGVAPTGPEATAVVPGEHFPAVLRMAASDIIASPRSLSTSLCDILILGPANFRPGVWSTRASYIFPDLVGSLSQSYQIVFVTARVPVWALDDAQQLVARYNTRFHQITEQAKLLPNEQAHEYWTRIAIAAAVRYRPRLMTNVFGGPMFGFANAYASQLVGARTLMRVAGDEIASRVCIGHYEEGVPSAQAGP